MALLLMSEQGPCLKRHPRVTTISITRSTRRRKVSVCTFSKYHPHNVHHLPLRIYSNRNRNVSRPLFGSLLIPPVAAVVEQVPVPNHVVPMERLVLWRRRRRRRPIRRRKHCLVVVAATLFVVLLEWDLVPNHVAPLGSVSSIP